MSHPNTQSMVECWEPSTKFEVSEATEVDGKHVLGRVRGNFFVPNGTSRNKRFYPKELWEKVCKDSNVQKKMGEKLMFGTIGHGQKIDDFTLLEGKMTHIVVSLGLEGEQGIGEALILDTPAGRVLNTVLRAGSMLRVSSRANGSFKGEHNGIPIVDPETYMLETFDFVIDPGFFQANPKLVESLEQLVSDIKNENNEDNKGEIEMSTPSTLVENLAKENGTIKADLEKATGEVETLKNENLVMRDKLKHVEFEYEKIKGFKKVAEELKTKIAAFEALGTSEEMAKLTESVEKFVEEVGTFTDVKKALLDAEKTITEYKELGPAKKISAALDRAYECIAEYKKIGTPKDIMEVMARTQASVEEAKAEKKKAEIMKLAKELGVSEEKITKLHGKMDESEIRDLFKDMQAGNKIQNTFKKTAPTTAITEGKEGEGAPKTPSMMEAPRLQRLMESFSR